MKKIILIAFAFLPLFGKAQVQQKMNLSLQEAIQLGLQNRYDVKSKSFNAYLAKNKISSKKKVWIPDLSAEGNIQYNTQLRTTIVPKSFAAMAGTNELKLGAKNVSSFGLSLNQPLFQPGINTDVKIAKANLALQNEKIKGDKIDVKNAIAKAYFDVLLKQLQFKIAKEEEQRFFTYKQLVHGELTNGVAIKNEYLRAKLDEKNAQIKTQTMQQNYLLALHYLKYQINVPPHTKISLTDSIGKIDLIKNLQPPSDIVENRTEIKQLKLKKRENKLRLKRVRQNALPSISFVGYYAQLYQNDNFRYTESKWWSPQSYLGLKIDIPITANFSNKNNIQTQEIKEKQLGMTLKQRKSDVRFQIQKARTDLENAQENRNTAKKNYDLSQRIYKNQQQQFKLGAFDYNKLLDTEKSMHKSEENYIQAVYKYIRAKIAYWKAVGEW